MPRTLVASSLIVEGSRAVTKERLKSLPSIEGASSGIVPLNLKYSKTVWVDGKAWQRDYIYSQKGKQLASIRDNQISDLGAVMATE